MKFMIMHKHDPKTETGHKPSSTLIAAMGQLVGGMVQSGKLLDGAGLGASATRSRVTVERGERTVVHGPYAGGNNELPAAYAMVKVGAREEAIEWATKMAAAVRSDVELEVGKVNEPWDIGVGEKPANAPLRYLILLKATPATERGELPDLSAVKKQMAEQGVLLTSAELKPSSKAKRLAWRGGKHTMLDGPFAESKELIGGYAVLELGSLGESVAFATNYAQILLKESEGLEIDIRPVA